MIESIWNIPAVPMQIKYNQSKAKSEGKPRDLDDELSLAMLSSTPRSHHHAKHRSRPRLLQRSQALTERERKLAFNWTNTCVTGDQTPRFGIKRSKTLLEKPEQVYKPRKWYSEPSTADFIRHLRNWNKETEEKLKETMHVLSMQRSKSDLDVRPPDAHGIGGPIHGAGMFRERESIFFENPEALRRESIQQGTKQEVKISKAVVPKKGLIALSTDEQGFGMINVIGDKQGIPSHESPHLGSGKKQPTSLIRRKDILDQIKQGNRLLEEYEERQKQEEEMTKTLGEYTMMDLQSHILGMTDARALKRQKSQTYNSPVPPNKTGPPSDKDKKPITLPKLKTLNPFD